ncbi:hypothetical protein DAC17_23 [Bacteroides phage DAC17]|nr:hypothetical protein DAC17_23 [Bacteroides phage DAC17]
MKSRLRFPEKRAEEVKEEVNSNTTVLGPHSLRDLIVFEAVSRYKSVARQMRRNKVTQFGTMIPKRPFNNRANTSGRKGTHSRVNNEYKKEIYGRIKAGL